MELTLKQLVQCYDAKLVDSWDHTATVSCLVYNLTGLLNNIVSKRKVPPKSLYSFHPYRENKTRFKVTTKNISVLRDIGRALVASKR